MADVQPKSRRPRADAERNRQRLLETAKAVFARDGAAASLEEIARTAGVGIGTLYRHFPARDDLIEAVYQQAIGQLGVADRLSETRNPVGAIRE
ncbi:MAG: TetR family transcriptional regulator [Hyphomonas sp.]